MCSSLWFLLVGGWFPFQALPGFPRSGWPAWRHGRDGASPGWGQSCLRPHRPYSCRAGAGRGLPWRARRSPQIRMSVLPRAPPRRRRTIAAAPSGSAISSWTGMTSCPAASAPITRSSRACLSSIRQLAAVMRSWRASSSVTPEAVERTVPPSRTCCAALVTCSGFPARSSTASMPSG